MRRTIIRPPLRRRCSSRRCSTPAQNKTVTTLAEIIIPQTDTAGATKAKVNEFIDAVLADAKPKTTQKFLDGLAWIDTRSQADSWRAVRGGAGRKAGRRC